MKWYALLFIAVIIEGLISYVRMLVVDKRFQWQVFAAMLLGVGCALAFKIDLFTIAGIPAALPYVGEILTGVLLSRGSNYVFELLGKLDKVKTQAAALEQMPDNEVDIINHEETEVEAHG